VGHNKANFKKIEPERKNRLSFIKRCHSVLASVAEKTGRWQEKDKNN
jgi:hypothetical protein